MTTEEEKEAAEKAAAAAKEKAEKDAADKAQKEKEAAEKAAAAKPSKKKAIKDLKSTDDVVVRFKNPVAKEEDGENIVDKEPIDQHVKYAFWLGLRKDDKGNVLHSIMKGAKLIGYVEDGKVIEF